MSPELNAGFHGSSGVASCVLLARASSLLNGGIDVYLDGNTSELEVERRVARVFDRSFVLVNKKDDEVRPGSGPGPIGYRMRPHDNCLKIPSRGHKSSEAGFARRRKRTMTKVTHDFCWVIPVLKSQIKTGSNFGIS